MKKVKMNERKEEMDTMKGEMNMKIRILTILLAALFLLGLFTGCAGSSTTAATASTTAKATTTAATTAATTEPPEVTLHIFMGGLGPQKDTDEVLGYLEEQVNEYLPNTRFEWTLLTFKEYKEKIHKALAAGETIDLQWFGWKQNLATEIADGNLLPFDPYLAEFGQDILAYYGDAVLDAHRYTDGQLYFVPAWQGLTNVHQNLIVRKSVYDKLTADEVASITKAFVDAEYNPTVEASKGIYDKLELILARAKETGTIGAGARYVDNFFAFNMGDAEWRYSFYSVSPIAHVDFGDDSFTVIDNWDNDQMRLLFETAAKWHDAGYIASDVLSNQNYATAGEDGFVYSIGGVQGMTDPEKVLSEQAGIDLKCIEMGGPDQLVLGVATGEAIPFTAENPARAVQFLNLLFSPEGKSAYRTFIYGLEGKHWEKTTDEDTVNVLGGAGDPSSEWNYGTYNWLIGTSEYIFNTQGASVELYKQYKENEKIAYVQPVLSFMFDSSSVSLEESQVLAVRDEYWPVLQTGSKGVTGWEAYYQEFLAKLDAAGYDKYLAEVQKQLDEFVARTGAKW
ncbi:MAG TPA: hypothetical protein DD640_07030 [Clostridiales bacterium]|nr:hypothetical protein [Clostridiales bacterium]